MKAKLIIAFLALWLAAPNRVANAETPPPQDPEKLTLVTLFVGGCVVAVVGTGIYVALKLKKRYGGTNGLFNAERRFGTNLLSALTDTNASFVAISGEPSDVPYLLSLATAQDSSGRFVLEQSTDLQTWTELGRFADENFLAVHSADSASCFYRLRVGP